MLAPSFNHIAASHERRVEQLYNRILSPDTLHLLISRPYRGLDGRQISTNRDTTQTVRNASELRSCLNNMTDNERGEYIVSVSFQLRIGSPV
jgi:hypothetical protein